MSRISQLGGPFAIVPQWILTRTPATDRGNVVLLWVTLWGYADRDTLEAWPSRRTLADQCGMSVDTVDRVKRKLESIGALIVERRHQCTTNAQTSNRYILCPVPADILDPKSYAQGGAANEGGGRTGAAGGAAPEGHELITNELDPHTPTTETAAACGQCDGTGWIQVETPEGRSGSYSAPCGSCRQQGTINRKPEMSP